MKGIIKDTLILFVITLISGLVLGYVYDITKEPIANQQAIAKAKACQAVFDDADNFSEMDILAFASATSYDNGRVDEVLEAKDASGNTLGYVITMTSTEGYGGELSFLIGIKSDGTVNGISFTKLAETAGLGMKAKEDSFKNQFNDRKVDKFVYTKNGASTENEIDAISAATITTNAVTNAANGALDFFYANLAGGAANE